MSKMLKIATAKRREICKLWLGMAIAMTVASPYEGRPAAMKRLDEMKDKNYGS